MADGQTQSEKLSISKEEVQLLPLARYEGPTHVIARGQPLAEICRILEQEPVLGFDTESRPSFKKGQSFLPSLIQFATRDAVYLLQIDSRTLPDEIVRVMENPLVIKAGLALQQDLTKLKQIRMFHEKKTVDLAQIAAQKGHQKTGLRSLAALLLGIRISKSAQVTNWSRTDLTPAQIQYAATDAWASRELYFKLTA